MGRAPYGSGDYDFHPSSYGGNSSQPVVQNGNGSSHSQYSGYNSSPAHWYQNSQKQAEGGFTDSKPAPLEKARRIQKQPVLTFGLYAYTKLRYIRDIGDTETGFMAVCRDPENPTYIHDIVMVKQTCNTAHVEFDDISLADYFEDRSDEGLKPSQFGRIWLHTHPGNSPNPSGVDEDTFARVFGGCDWSIMFIIARNDATYARLQFSAGPGAYIELKVEYDLDEEYAACNRKGWRKEYDDNVLVSRYGKTYSVTEWREYEERQEAERKARVESQRTIGFTSTWKGSDTQAQQTASTGSTPSVREMAQQLGAPSAVLLQIDNDVVQRITKLVVARSLLIRDLTQVEHDADLAWDNSTKFQGRVDEDEEYAKFEKLTQEQEDLEEKIEKIETEVRELSRANPGAFTEAARSGGFETTGLLTEERTGNEIGNSDATTPGDSTVVVQTPGVADAAGPVLAAAGAHSAGALEASSS